MYFGGFEEGVKNSNYLARKVDEIQSVTNSMVWKDVPTNINPVDLVSRGAAVHILTSNDL